MFHYCIEVKGFNDEIDGKYDGFIEDKEIKAENNYGRLNDIYHNIVYHALQRSQYKELKTNMDKVILISLTNVVNLFED
jgi:hypothetical protein